MEITLEKIELVKDRTGVSYSEAKEALEKTKGSVVDAIILIEEQDNKTASNSGIANDILTNLKALVKKGNVTKITITRDGEIIANVPVNAGIIGVAIAPWGMLAGLIACFGLNCKVSVTTDDGQEINVNEKAKKAYDTAKDKTETAWNFAKDKAPDVWEQAKSAGETAWDFAKDKGNDAWDFAKEKLEERKGTTGKKKSKLFDDIDISNEDTVVGKEDEK